jgi:hypothetical protein
VPQKLVRDNLKTAVLSHPRGESPILQPALSGLRRSLRLRAPRLHCAQRQRKGVAFILRLIGYI